MFWFYSIHICIHTSTQAKSLVGCEINCFYRKELERDWFQKMDVFWDWGCTLVKSGLYKSEVAVDSTRRGKNWARKGAWVDREAFIPASPPSPHWWRVQPSLRSRYQTSLVRRGMKIWSALWDHSLAHLDATAVYVRVYDSSSFIIIYSDQMFQG